MPNDLHPLLERIRELTDVEADGPPAPLLASIEHTLTDGYARALALEAETIRIEKEIGEILAKIKRGESADELPTLADRLARTETDLVRLRGLLDSLRRRADLVRLAAGDGATRSRSGPRTPRPGYGYRSAAS